MLLFFLIYTGISMSPLRNESAGLFTSACVFAYSIYCERGRQGRGARAGGGWRPRALLPAALPLSHACTWPPQIAGAR